MAANWIGVVYDTITKKIRMIVVPDYDYQLDAPHHLQIGVDDFRVKQEHMRMLRIPMGHYKQPLNHDDISALIAEAEAKLAK